MLRVARRALSETMLPAALVCLFASTLAAVYSSGAMSLVLPIAFTSVCLLVGRFDHHSRRCVRQDLARLARELDEPELPDLTSLHPQTPTGRHMAANLQTLLHRVQQAVAEENAVREEIERAQALRVGFVASMGHDLRGPLSSMLGFAELLLIDESAEAAAQTSSVQTVHQRTMDLLTLIDEMLDWARMEAGRLTLSLAPVSASQVLAETRALCEKRSAGRGLMLEASATEPLPEVQGDLRHIARAIVAVLGDAIRSASKVPVQVRVSAAPEGGLAVHVHDPTLLIREEDRERFFEAFRPSYAPSGKRIAGLGLGAACAKALITAHGGALSFESSHAAGTVFRIWLPAKA